ncbi:MAG: MauE/DoxX family redox-associated membrane protein [Pyrinomonadaceae bacterium]
MNFGKVLRVMVYLSRFGLAAFFLFTAGAKLWVISGFARNVSELLSAMHFNYERWMWPATVGVIAAEVITAVMLLLRRTVRPGSLLAAALLIGFGAFALYYVYVLHGEALECGCFGGIIASQLGVTTALRNLALLIPALLVFFGHPRRHRSGGGDSQANAAIAAN